MDFAYSTPTRRMFEAVAVASIRAAVATAVASAGVASHDEGAPGRSRWGL